MGAWLVSADFVVKAMSESPQMALGLLALDMLGSSYAQAKAALGQFCYILNS